MLFDLVSNQGDFKRVTMLTYGFAKSGKTTLNHAFGKLFDKPPLLIMTEDGLGSLEAHAVRITNWAGYSKLVKGLDLKKKELHEQYSCLVVDLVNEVEQMCTNYVCKLHNVESLGDVPHGKAWFIQGAQFRSGISELLALGLPVKFICHSKEKTMKDNRNQDVSYYEPDLGKQAKAYILGKCDVIGFIEPTKPDGSSVISFNSHLAPDTGSRFPQISKAYTMDHRDLSNTLIAIEKDFKNEN
jgi:hypothetical protein